MDRITAARVFIDIAHSGSFTATAERLGMSRPMVTRYLEAMEGWLDARLLHRTTRKVTLTSQGQNCLAEVEQWLDTADHFVNKIKGNKELSGSIKIASSLSFTHSHLISAITEFMALHPKVLIDIDLQDKVDDLIKSRIDLAIRIASDPDPSLIGKPIAECKSVLVASQQYLDTFPDITKPEDLSNHNCLNHVTFDRHVWHLYRNNEHIAVPVECRLTANDATTLLNAAKCGGGIATQPTFLANAAILEKSLVQVLPEWAPVHMKIYALYSSRKHLSPTVRALIDFLEAYFNKHPWD
mgnify:CR=1 FL=1